MTAAIVEDKKTVPVHGVTMNGQLATYEFRFAHKLPEWTRGRVQLALLRSARDVRGDLT